MMTTIDKLKSLILMLNEAKTGKIDVYPADLALFEELIAELEEKIRHEKESQNEDMFFLHLSGDEIKSIHSLMMSRPLGHMDELRKKLAYAYDSVVTYELEMVGEV